ncbi:nucleotidyltransferase [candidate division WOR-1 bacterium RIFCSPLOWO2_02_FULL_46_20]|uniref:Nucleotidyltransferase n=2 Tax=Saganbacteria TaxID=1703751 RepID=A0A1F4R8X8_UNCSA|nr:MAG: nucleotidyltransferase [candidate division WOR-1 bacterium RIFCSPHIGHO2_02_FULL_45_12]OGC04634.1 MAG: nucleotidyltransferase [candidate division WOR-1 bacterium RIFCSPLOWO2_02_FULL_46_20]OGC08882.1 MAG: nucleotidyltransferase [candidate division WOR-1 bacterium RIFCSPLOWO2_12_FULL_45_9]
MASLKKNKEVLKKHLVKRIGLFGSYVRGDENEKSDMDFLVEMSRPSYEHFFDLATYLENLFGKKIELITLKGMSPHIWPYIKKEIKWYET